MHESIWKKAEPGILKDFGFGEVFQVRSKDNGEVEVRGMPYREAGELPWFADVEGRNDGGVNVGSDRWEVVSDGFSNQCGYTGPVMHDSEYLGCGMEAWVLENPGTYVSVQVWYDEWVEECAECDGDNGCDGQWEHYPEGWVLLRLKDGEADVED